MEYHHNKHRISMLKFVSSSSIKICFGVICLLLEHVGLYFAVNFQIASGLSAKLSNFAPPSDLDFIYKWIFNYSRPKFGAKWLLLHRYIFCCTVNFFKSMIIKEVAVIDQKAKSEVLLIVHGVKRTKGCWPLLWFSNWQCIIVFLQYL